MTATVKPLTDSQLSILLNLAKRERLHNYEGHGKSISTEGKGFSGAALHSLNLRGLIKLDYIAIFNSTYVELTELGGQVAMAVLIFERTHD